MKMTMTATGDSILVQGYPEGGYEGFSEIKEYINRAQAKFCNLEMNASEWGINASVTSGGTWMNTATLKGLDDVLGFGFNFVSTANNHSMDYGAEGLMNTLENLSKYPVSVAGTGANLGKATEACYRTFRSGRVAMIGVTASFNGLNNDFVRAGSTTDFVPGRPGVNALRNNKFVTVTKEHMEQIRQIRNSTQISAAKDRDRANGTVPELPADMLDFGSVMLKLTQNGTEEVVTCCNKDDLARILSAVRDAREMADYVVIMYHAHDIKDNEMASVPDFSKEFAHACIDAGADVILGGGTHQFKPIELYKGKPIFYSLGNFCFQSNVVIHAPYEMRQGSNTIGLSTAQAYAKKNKEWTVGHHTQYFNFRTVIPYLEFEDGKLVKAELKPVELGFEKPRTFKGIPYPATKEVTDQIFARLTELSYPYGTSLRMNENGNIDIVL